MSVPPSVCGGVAGVESAAALPTGARKAELYATPGGVFSWVWYGIDPYAWNVFQSTDGGHTWTFFNSYDPQERQDNGLTAGVLYNISGADSAGYTKIPVSNNVTGLV